MIAIVPLKLKSSRVPNKNWKDLCGKPLFAYILNTVLSCNEIRDVYVTVDCAETANRVMERFPMVHIIMRPEDIAKPTATANDIIRHAITEIQGDDFLYTHATNPMLSKETITNGIREYKKGHCDTLMGVTYLYDRAYYRGKAVNHNPQIIDQTQDLFPIAIDNSCLYIFSRDAFAKHGRIGERPCFFEIPQNEAIDIDTNFDWEVATLVCKRKYTKGKE